MTRLFLAAAAATLTFAAPALATERTFTHEGVTYNYTVTQQGDVKVLEGTAAPTGEKFRLTVKNGWVSGYAANARVSFRAPKDASALQVAQR
ncbi:hypothetical protein AB2M62_11165 [Sphingomonas sp. MMS12-HWE2-04]|uniref:hypothetical protein n=1 Tax=Sphingomonas sp. MMS12-HWE2-04 TaxID=3234199 RepID=UPI00384F3481